MVTSESVRDPLLSSREVKARLGGVSDMTVHRWLQRGILPAPVQIARRNYWRSSEIEAVVASAPRRAITPRAA